MIAAIGLKSFENKKERLNDTVKADYDLPVRILWENCFMAVIHH